MSEENVEVARISHAARWRRDTGRAMSEENVEVVREHIDAFRRKDDAPRTLSTLDPHVVVDCSRVARLDFTVAYGHEEVTHTIRHHIGAFKDLEPQRATDLGSGAVLVLGIEKERRGKGHAVPVRQSFAALYTVIDGKIARVTLFPTEAEALKAAGLPE